MAIKALPNCLAILRGRPTIWLSNFPHSCHLTSLPIGSTPSLTKRKSSPYLSKGHFTHEPRAVTKKLWEPKRKCPKAIPRHLQNHGLWSRIFKCSVKPYVTGPSTKCYFNEFLFMQGPHTWSNIINKQLWNFGFSWSPGFALGIPPRSGFKNNPSDHETWSIQCHVGIHVDFSSILRSLTPLVPQA